MQRENKTLDTKKCSNAVLLEFSAKYDLELNSQQKSRIIDVLKPILKSEPKEYLRYVKALIQMDQNVSAYWILLAEFCAMYGYKLSKVLVFKKCVKNATKYGKDAEIARFKYLLGLAYIDNMQFAKARSYISQSIEIKKDLKKI